MYWKKTSFHILLPQIKKSAAYGLDFWMNEEPVWNETGHYSTELFTKKAISLINDQDNTKVSLLIKNTK